MSVYHKFTRNDILFSTIHARPRVTVKYGVDGWAGSTGISASLSLYGGIRSRQDVKASDFTTSGLSIYPLDLLDTHSIDKVLSVSGSYPSTGSIRFVRCDNVAASSLTDITSVRWYDEHFSPIERLYDFYSNNDSNYFLGSYDFYAPLFLVDDANPYSIGPWFIFSGAIPSPQLPSPGPPPAGGHRITSSFAIEAWVKLVPNGTSSSPDTVSTLASIDGKWSIYVDYQNKVGIRTPLAPYTASSPDATITPGVWTHLAVNFSASISASIYVNGVLKDTLAVPGDNILLYPVVNNLMIGSYVSSSATSTDHRDGWNGFISETRAWGKTLSRTQIITNLSGTLINSSSTDLHHYARYNDGPSGSLHGFAMGSGAFDYSPRAKHGYWDPTRNVHWQPSDHPTFIPKLEKTNLGINSVRLFHVPSMFYGRQISPGSVRIRDGVYNQKKIVRVFNDDGRGSLYLSGSMTRDSSDENYTGEKRRKVGNVFYTEGLIVFTDPALYDMFDSSSSFWQPTMALSGVFGDLISLDFRGQTRLHTKTFNCRLNQTEGNASNNPTFSYSNDQGTIATDDDRIEVIRNDGITYITSVGLYNEDHQLVAVAKLAQPIRKREKDKICLRLKMDF